jgi:hypothetical protein
MNGSRKMPSHSEAPLRSLWYRFQSALSVTSVMSLIVNAGASSYQEAMSTRTILALASDLMKSASGGLSFLDELTAPR